MNTKIANRYILQDELGEGGMGTVYAGLDTKTDQLVAVKALKSKITDASMVERFIREGEALRQLNHPNIVKMLDSAEEDNQHYLIMELVSGGSLKALLDKQEVLPVSQIMEIALDISDALTRAHRLNIIHRDIKPANVLLDPDGTCRLTDFGIARTTNSTITETGTIMGTTAYLAPEILQGEPAQVSADIWAFGVMLFEMLTGSKPFGGDHPGSVVYSIMGDSLPDIEELRPDSPPALTDLISRMLIKDPAERIPGVRQIGAELEAMLQNRVYDTGSAIKLNSSQVQFNEPVFQHDTTPSATSIPEQLRHNLPSQTTAFVGREQEIATSSELLQREDLRLLTITGPGGIGKTRICLEIGNRLLDTFNDGVFFISLASVQDPENVPMAIAQSMDIRQGGDKAPLDSVKDYLKTKEILLLLDNFEHLTPAAPVLTELLTSAPQLKILVTSRRVLNVRGEHELPLKPLSVPQPGSLTSPHDLEQYEAIQLFVQRATATKANFELTSENAPAIVSICHQLDGIPLAVELAAARIKMLPPDKLLSRLSNRLTLLTGGAKDLPARQQTLRNTIDWSYSLLEPDEQTLFARLAVFVNGFTIDTAEEIVNSEATLDVFDGIESLMSNSLLWQRESKTGDMRFAMLETIREYALEKLKEAGEDSQIRAQHAQYFANQIQETAVNGYSAHAMDWLLWCDDEHDNLLAALNWSQEKPEHNPAGIQLIFGMTWFWYRRGFVPEGYAWCKRVLSNLNDNIPPLLKGFGLATGGALATWTGDLDQALEWANESTTILGAVDEGMLYAFSLMGTGVVLLNRGDEEQAHSYFETSLAMFRDLQVEYFASITLMHLGNVELANGNDDIALARHNEAYEVAQKIGDNWLIASVENNLGEVARVRGDYEKAGKYYKQSETLYREMGDKGDLARLIHSRAYIALYHSEYEIADRKFREALDMFIILGSKRGIAECLTGLAVLAGEQGKSAHAVQLYEAASKIMDDSHAGWWPADRVEITRFLNSVQNALDAETVNQAKEKGKQMSLDEAIAFATQETA